MGIITNGLKAITLTVAMTLGIAGFCASPAVANEDAPVTGYVSNLEADAPFDIRGDYAQAPYGNAMPNIIKNYLRAAPFVGTGGVVKLDAYPMLQKLGFKTVINLNTIKQGAGEEAGIAKAAGLQYFHLPVSTKAPLPDQVAAFVKLVSDKSNYPILVHCRSSNRVGALWAMYRVAVGIPGEIAIQEGRNVGMKTGREKAVRIALDLTKSDFF